MSARTAARCPRAGRGKCAVCGEWNTLTEEAPTPIAPPGPGSARGAHGRASCSRRSTARCREAPRFSTGHQRIRPRDRRRHRAGLGAADRRRSRHRQIDAAAAARRPACAAPAGAPSTSPARRRQRRSACAPSASACRDAPVALAARPISPTSWRRSRPGRRPISSSSTPSRRCGPICSTPPPAR